MRPALRLSCFALAAVAPLLVLRTSSAQEAPKPGDPPAKGPEAATSALADAPPADPPVSKKTKHIDETPNNVRPEGVVAKTFAGTGGFVDTRLSWTFGDDDILRRTGQALPASPLPSIGDRPQYRLFFDNLNSRFAGRENLTHLVLYKKLPAFIPNLETEAAVVLRFDLTSLAANQNSGGTLSAQSLYDSGSYLRLFYKTGESADGKRKFGASLTFFPLDTDRFRLGYLYDVSWGGTNRSRNESIFPGISSGSPGLKFQYDAESFYLFAGFKTAQIVQAQTILKPGSTNDVETVRVGETNYGFLGGLGADPASLIHLDAGFGYFQQGRFEFPDMRPVAGSDTQAARVFTYGGSARVVLHYGMAAPQSIDFQLYRNDPSAPMMLFKPEVYKADEFAFSLAFEGSQLMQNLHDPNPQKVGATKVQPARSAALSGVIKAGYARIGVAAIYRDLPFVLRNVPGFVPFEALDTVRTKSQSEVFLAGTVDYYLESLRLRPGIGGGVQFPSTFSAESQVGNAPVLRTVVIRSQGNNAILPEGEKRKPIIQARFSLRWDISEMFNAIGWLQVVQDPNATLVTRDPTSGTAELRTFQSSTLFGFGGTLAARF
ncbi:MAG: hypothetical protein JNL79_22410 [Myxococcales bacterium]|nr:hypothetical protein [Myxococcales bacterium]